MLALVQLFACAPEEPAPDTGDAEPALVGDLPADAADSFGTWDGQVYLTRMSGMESGERGQWAPFAVGEVYDAPITWPLGGGLPGLPEGCSDATTLPFPELVTIDVGATLPLAVGARTFELEREAWGGGFDYWRTFVNDLECDCATGTVVALPATSGEVVAPEPVVLADDFADAWGAWEDSGLLDLRWTRGTGDTRITVYIGYEAGVSRHCILDDDGVARVVLPVVEGEDPTFLVDRIASRAIVHPTYGTIQLTARETIFPTLATR